MALTLFRDMMQNDLPKHAYAMAYVTLLSLIPALAAFFGIIGLFVPSDPDSLNLVTTIKSFVLENLASTSGENVVQFIDETLKKLNFKAVGVTGIAGMLVTLMLLLRQIEIALNRIFHVAKPRNLLKRFLYFWTFITLGSLLASIAIGTSASFNLGGVIKKEHLDGPSWFSAWWPFFSFTFMFFLVYKLIPNCSVGSWQALAGAIPAGLLLHFAGKFYGVYIEFTSYEMIYGTLAAMPLFLFWLYVVWLIVLLGAVLAWRMGEGFQMESEGKEDLPIKDRHLRAELQSALPLIILRLIKDLDDPQSKEGISFQTLQKHLGLAPSYLEESLNLLLDHLFIVERSAKKEEEDIRQSSFYLTRPVNEKSYADLTSLLKKPVLDKLAGEESELPEATKIFVKKMLQGATPVN